MLPAPLIRVGLAARSRVRHSVTSPAFWLRLLQLNVGLMLMGLGLAVSLAAGVGLGPWAAFHEGLAVSTGMSFGQALVLVGIVVVGVSWWWTGYRPGPGTFVNMAVVGPWVDLFQTQAWLPVAPNYAWGMAEFLVGTTLIGMASGMYITAGFGAGPRDGLVLGLTRLLRLSVRRTRSLLELVVLATGFLLGGAVGVGTVVFALTIGPVMQFSIRLFTWRTGDSGGDVGAAPAAGPGDGSPAGAQRG